MEESIANEVNEDSDGDVDISNVKKSYTVDDITSGMSKQMKISKKKGGATVDIQMDTPTKKIQKSKALKETHKKKRSRSQLTF